VIGIFVLGLAPRPLLVAMEPAVQKFMRDFGRHVTEPDCAPHTYGAGCNKPPAADVQKTLDAVAKGATDVQKTMAGSGAGAGTGSAGAPPGAAPGSGSGGPAAPGTTGTGAAPGSGSGGNAGTPTP